MHDDAVSENIDILSGETLLKGLDLVGNKISLVDSDQSTDK